MIVYRHIDAVKLDMLVPAQQREGQHVGRRTCQVGRAEQPAGIIEREPRHQWSVSWEPIANNQRNAK